MFPITKHRERIRRVNALINSQSRDIDTLSKSGCSYLGWSITRVKSERSRKISNIQPTVVPLNDRNSISNKILMEWKAEWKCKQSWNILFLRKVYPTWELKGYFLRVFRLGKLIFLVRRAEGCMYWNILYGMLDRKFYRKFNRNYFSAK